MPLPPSDTRRRLLGALSGVLVAAMLRPHAMMAAELTGHPVAGPHPTPRRGITAGKLPTREQLAESPAAIPVFDLVLEIPEIIDGVRCNCGCAELSDFYSLLSCFETTTAMAIHCEICQAHGRLVHRLHKAGRSLDEIRKGIDARFG
ncbi:MAG: hypothetical protein ABIZ91_12935 [Gemmatimonadaceae bacterium]